MSLSAHASLEKVSDNSRILDEKEVKNTVSILGDAHACSPKIVKHLNANRTLEFKDNKDYERLIKIYREHKADISDLTQYRRDPQNIPELKRLAAALRKSLDNKDAPLPAEIEALKEKYPKMVRAFENLEAFKKILKDAKINPHENLFIGDEFADSGENDVFTLLIYDRLREAKVPLTTLLSNHGREFIKVVEKLRAGEPHQYTSDQKNYIERPEKQNSLLNLGVYVECGLIEEEEIVRIVNDAYYPTLNLIYCAQDAKNNSLVFAMHAPNGLETIMAQAVFFELKCEDENALFASSDKFVETVNTINVLFKANYLNQNKVHLLEDLRISLDNIKNPFYREIFEKLDKLESEDKTGIGREVHIKYPFSRTMDNRGSRFKHSSLPKGAFTLDHVFVPTALADGTQVVGFCGHDAFYGMMPSRNAQELKENSIVFTYLDDRTSSTGTKNLICLDSRYGAQFNEIDIPKMHVFFQVTHSPKQTLEFSESKSYTGLGLFAPSVPPNDTSSEAPPRPASSPRPSPTGTEDN